MGRHVRFKYSGTVSGVARGFETSSRTAREDYQHGIARRFTALGRSCSLLFLEGCGAYVDESDGEGVGSGDFGELRGARDDRPGREVGGCVHETNGQADSDEEERHRRRDCGGGAVLCHRASFYYWADHGGRWRVGVVSASNAEG